MRLLLVLFVFLVVEIFVFLLVSFGYDRLARRGAVPWNPSVKVRVLLAALLLPLVYAGLAAFAFAVAGAAPEVGLQQLAGLHQPAGLPTSLPTVPVLAPEADPAMPEPDPDDESQPPQVEQEQTIPTPSSPPDLLGELPGGKIVYTCQIFKTGLRDQICLINPDGSGYRRLTLDDSWDHNFPSLSPDGQSVVYAAKEPEDSFQIFEMDLNSGAFWPLTRGETDSAPAFSPDGSMIVFNRLWESANTIWIMDRDGSNQRLVFGPPEGHGWDPVWSPDGRRILFASDRAGRVQLYVIDLDGTNLQQLTNLSLLRGRSDWSPDGTAIATYLGEPWEREIVIMGPDGSNPEVITDGGNNLAPSFSPDGGWIVYTSYRDNYRDELGCEIYIMRRDGRDIARLTHNDICDWQPRWGP